MGTLKRRLPSPPFKRPNHARPTGVSPCRSLPVACVALDDTGRIRDLNPAAAKLLRRSRSQLLGRYFRSLVREADRITLARHLRLRHTRSQRADVGVALMRPGTSPAFVQLRSTKDRDSGANSPGCLTVLIDVTGREQIREALAASEAKYRRLVEGLKDRYFFYQHDANGRFTYLSPSITNILGYTPDEFRVHYAANLTSAPLNRDAIRRTKQSIRGIRQPPYELEVRHKDGSPRQFEVMEAPLFDGRGRVVAVEGIAHDITERRRLEAGVSAAAEAEKVRFARDLHDGLGQQLTGLRFLVEGLKVDLLAGQPALAERVNELCRLLEETAAQTRALVHSLYAVPPTPDGLLIALHNLADRVRRENRIQCRFRCDTAVLINNTVAATHLYRIAQEAVRNAIKHSRASRIHIGLRLLNHSLELTLRDNGVGFGCSPSRGLGLPTMRHRTTQLGGELRVRNSPRGGAELVCHTPLAVLGIPDRARR